MVACAQRRFLTYIQRRSDSLILDILVAFGKNVITINESVHVHMVPQQRNLKRCIAK